MASTKRRSPVPYVGHETSNSVFAGTDVETKTERFNKAEYKSQTPRNQTHVRGRRCIVTKSPGSIWSPARQGRNEELLRPFLGLKSGKSPQCNPLPSQRRLLQLFDSNSDEQHMSCRIARGGLRVDDMVGTLNNGYTHVFVDYRQYRLHRLKWKYHYGIDPNGPLDHINGSRSDNRLSNLRETDPLQNARNRHVALSNTGRIGVSYCQSAKRYLACIGAADKSINLGKFVALDCAIAARQHAEEFLFGFCLDDMRGAV